MSGPNAPYTKLDSTQTTKQAFDETQDAHRVMPISGSPVTEPYDQQVLTYITSGNGTGEVGTITYKLNGSTVATLTLTYNADNKVIDISKT